MTGLKEALNYFAQSACTQQERDQVHTIRAALAEQEAEIARLRKAVRGIIPSQPPPWTPMRGRSTQADYATLQVTRNVWEELLSAVAQHTTPPCADGG